LDQQERRAGAANVPSFDESVTTDGGYVVAMDHGKRFVARAEAGRGWKIWDKQQKRFWGPVLSRQPTLYWLS
jgi:hypothetical protein